MAPHRPLAIALCTLILSSAPGLGRADEQPFAERINPYLTESALAVVRVPLERLQTTAIGEVAESLGVVTEETRTALQTVLISVDAFRAQLVAHGVTDALIVFETEYVMQGPYGLFVYRAGAKTERIQAALTAGMNLAGLAGVQQLRLVDLGGAFFVGSEAVLKRIQDPFPVERPGLAGAFDSVSEAAVQFVIVPSVDQSRAIREILPPFPAPFDDVDGKIVSRGVRFASLGIRLEPDLTGANLRVDAHLDAFDAESAEILRSAQHRALRLADGNAELAAVIPKIKDFCRQLEFQRTDQRLSVALDLRDATTREMATAISSLFEPALLVNPSNREINQLKQLGIAMHNWHDNYQVFPAHANYSPDGKPLLSWRVHILPYIEQSNLYSEFHLDEPWDSEHNRKLIARIPDIYRFPGSKADAGKTCYVLPILKSEAGITTGTKYGVKIQELTDGTSNTALIVAVDDERAVTWTQPADWEVDTDNPLAGLRTLRNAYVVLFADGSVRRLTTTVAKEEWWKALTKAGGEPLNLP